MGCSQSSDANAVAEQPPEDRQITPPAPRKAAKQTESSINNLLSALPGDDSDPSTQNRKYEIGPAAHDDPVNIENNENTTDSLDQSETRDADGETKCDSVEEKETSDKVKLDADADANADTYVDMVHGKESIDENLDDLMEYKQANHGEEATEGPEMSDSNAEIPVILDAPATNKNEVSEEPVDLVANETATRADTFQTDQVLAENKTVPAGQKPQAEDLKDPNDKLLAVRYEKDTEMMTPQTNLEDSEIATMTTEKADSEVAENERQVDREERKSTRGLKSPKEAHGSSEKQQMLELGECQDNDDSKNRLPEPHNARKDNRLLEEPSQHEGDNTKQPEHHFDPLLGAIPPPEEVDSDGDELDITAKDNDESSDESSNEDDSEGGNQVEEEIEDEPMLELKNVTAMTRVLIPEDQLSHKPEVPNRWKNWSGFGRGNSSNDSITNFSHSTMEKIKSPGNGANGGNQIIERNLKQSLLQKMAEINKLVHHPKDGPPPSEVSTSLGNTPTALPPKPVSPIKKAPPRSSSSEIDKARAFAASILVEADRVSGRNNEEKPKGMAGWWRSS